MDETPKRKISKIGSSATKGVPWVEGAKKIFEGAEYTTKVAAKMQDVEGSIIAVSRSVDEGKANFRFLSNVIYKTGLDAETTSENYQAFTGAMEGTSLQGEKANKIFRQVAEASVVMHSSTEQSKAAFLSLGNIMKNGVVQAEDLTGELGRMIPNLFQISADAMKMSADEFKAYVKANKLRAAEFLPKLGDELENKNKEKLVSEANSTSANINKISSAWNNYINNLGKAKTGPLTTVTGWIAGYVNNASEMADNENRTQDILSKYKAPEFGFFEQASSYLPSILSTISPKTQIESYAKAIHETFGVKEGLSIGDAMKNISTLSGTIRQKKEYFEGVPMSDMDKRGLAILENERAELVKYKKDYWDQKANAYLESKKPISNLHNKSSSLGGESGAISPQIIVYGGIAPNMIIQSVDGSIPAKDLKEKVGKAFLELISDVNQRTK